MLYLAADKADWLFQVIRYGLDFTNFKLHYYPYDYFSLKIWQNDVDEIQLHHPGSKQQLEEVWEKQDHMEQQQFDPKAFFMMHGEC